MLWSLETKAGGVSGYFWVYVWAGLVKGVSSVWF